MINDVVKNGFQPRLNVPAASTRPAEAETAAPADEPTAAKPAADTRQLDKAVSKLNEYVQNAQRKLSFSVSAETGRTIIKVYDVETDELIRQIPPEETIRLAENIDATTSHLFVKERA